jgi:hypothetical protein
MRFTAISLLLACLCACGTKPPFPDAGEPPVADAGMEVCVVLDPPDCSAPVPTYSELLPVFTSSCVVCHNGADTNGPWALTSYQALSDWEDLVRSEILKCSMPPEDAGFSLTLEERKQIFAWIRCGRPK